MNGIKGIIIFICSLISIHTLSLEADVANEMNEQLYLLESEKSFVFVDLNLTDRESSALNQFNIEKTAKFDQFGQRDFLEERLSTFLRSIGNNDHANVEITQVIITRLVDQVTAASGKNSAWVSLRAYTPESSFDAPRWHIDGGKYELDDIPLYPKLTYKFAATLRGPSTLLYSLTPEQRNIFVSHFDDRAYLGDFLNISNAESALPDQGVFFIVGDNDKGAVHSEPRCHESRLFFSVVAGEDAEIEDLYLRRKIQNDQSERSWEESAIYEKMQEEDYKRHPPEYWIDMCEQQNIKMKDGIHELILQYQKGLKLIVSLKDKSNENGFINFYLDKLESEAIYINHFNKMVDEFTMPSPGVDLMLESQWLKNENKGLNIVIQRLKIQVSDLEKMLTYLDAA